MSESTTADLAETIAAAAQERGMRVGVAESLTSGAVASALGAAPGASEWFRGGVVAYASEVKFTVLDVPEGPVVTREAALAMARGAAGLLGADLVVSVTGAGGPDAQDGREPGTVCFGLVHRGGEVTEEYRFPGGPEDVVRAATEQALSILHRATRHLDGDGQLAAQGS